MSINGRVDQIQIAFRRVPSGDTGHSRIEVSTGGSFEVSWRRDEHGISIELPHGTFGFDLRGRINDDGDLEYDLAQRFSDQEWFSKRFVREGEAAIGSAADGVKRAIKVKAQMPGKIIKVHVKEGDSVAKGQSLLVMEAMKMENEIRAPQAGVIQSLRAVPGQSVESGVELAVIE